MGTLVSVYLGVVDLTKVRHDPTRSVDIRPLQVGMPVLVGTRTARISAAGDKVALYHRDTIEHYLRVSGPETKTADDLLVRAFGSHVEAMLWVSSELIQRRPGKIVLTQLAPVH